MTTFEPCQTSYWSSPELDVLTGLHLTVTVNGTPTHGICAVAGVGTGGNHRIDFEDGRSAEWDAACDDTSITVH